MGVEVVLYKSVVLSVRQLRVENVRERYARCVTGDVTTAMERRPQQHWLPSTSTVLPVNDNDDRIAAKYYSNERRQ